MHYWLRNLLIGFGGWGLCPRFQGEEQLTSIAPFGGMSVRSLLSLNLTSQHHNQMVICQAYSPVLGEGTKTYFKLNVFCKYRVNCYSDFSRFASLAVSWRDQELFCA